MFSRLMEITQANENTRILDVGVTSDTRNESNFLEKLYPYPQNITAVGLENAADLEKECPGVKLVIADGKELPFNDLSFDLLTSFATIEHVGNTQNQRSFVAEICRVGKSCIITTPNRWYPMEVHTMMPFIHWLPENIYRSILKHIGKDFYADIKNLNLLDAKQFADMFPAEMHRAEYHFKLLSMISNLFFYAKW